MTDEELLSRYVAGDQDAFTQLFNSFQPMLCRYVQRKLRCDDWTANEIAQLTMVRVVCFSRGFRRGKMVQPWVLALADRVCRDWTKDRKRERMRVVQLEPV